ncbi:hypothetical protein [Nocardioides alcanivorans]|uniref:hypothetical protein n=1 Tax=Nocardioides alcanivorans TaxID=2897352 RepID=UPI001F1AD435|nr:hypothetical protein [Nocardioides alcanivorans]
MAVAAVVAFHWTRGAWAVFVLAGAGIIGFAVPWTRDAAATDESGMFVVGLLLLLAGGGLGLTLLLALTNAVTSRRQSRRNR